MSIDVPSPPSDAGSVPKWADERAFAEERNFPDEEVLRGQKRRNQLWALQVAGYLIPLLMVGLFTTFVAALFIWVWHFLTPETCLVKGDGSQGFCFHWLSGEQLSSIQSVIFSGALGAIVSRLAQKHLVDG